MPHWLITILNLNIWRLYLSVVSGRCTWERAPPVGLLRPLSWGTSLVNFRCDCGQTYTVKTKICTSKLNRFSPHIACCTVQKTESGINLLAIYFGCAYVARPSRDSSGRYRTRSLQWSWRDSTITHCLSWKLFMITYRPLRQNST